MKDERIRENCQICGKQFILFPGELIIHRIGKRIKHKIIKTPKEARNADWSVLRH